MTLNQLYRRLGKLIKKGHGRKAVCVDKESFSDNRESDGCTILDIACIDVRWIANADDDGGTKVNKDGTESGRTRVIFEGSSYSPEKKSQIAS